MKKLLTAILTVAMLLTVTACGQNASPVGTTPSATPVETPEATPTPEVTPTPVATPTPMATPTPQPERETVSLVQTDENVDDVMDFVLDILTSYSLYGAQRIPSEVGLGTDVISYSRSYQNGYDLKKINIIHDEPIAERTFAAKADMYISKYYYHFYPSDMVGDAIDADPSTHESAYIVFSVGNSWINTGIHKLKAVDYYNGKLTLTFSSSVSQWGAMAIWEDVMIVKVPAQTIHYGIIESVDITFEVTNI